MKKLSLMERPQHLPSAGDDLPSLAPPENTVPMPSTPQRAVASQPVPVPRSGGSGQRLKFTEEDDRILLAYVRDAQENGRPLRGNVIYKEIEDLVRGINEQHELRQNVLTLASIRTTRTNLGGIATFDT